MQRDDNYFDDKYDQMDRVESAPIVRDLVLASGAGEAPLVRLMCPRCNRRLTDVRLLLDHNWRPGIEVVGARPGVVIGSTPLGEDDYADRPGVRMKLRCPNRKCSYDGAYLESEMVKIYAIAARQHMREVTLPR